MKIINVFNELLAENYKTQTVNFIKQGIDADIVKQYIEKFKIIKDKGYKELFSDKVDVNVPSNRRGDIDAYKKFSDLEVVVDYVSGQRAVGTAISSEDIQVDGKPVYEDENFEIYFADTPRACIKYKGKLPYSWCIARSDSSNMFFTYRFKPYEPAFYFVKDKKEFDKEFSITNVLKDIASGKFKYPYHFFVVQVSKNAQPNDNETDQYIVTSANNDGDKQMSWNDIIKLKPKLANLKEVFKPKPFTKEEREKFERFKKGIDDKEFQKLSYEQKREYLDIYPAVGRAITTAQFLNLPNDLKNLYLSFGIGLNDEQYADIKNEKDLLKRYKQISERKYEEYLKKEGWERRNLKLSYTELLMLNDNQVREYFTTLNKKQINEFIRTYGYDKFDYLVKHAKDKISSININTINLIKQAASGSEEAIEKIDENIPENFEINIDGNKITIDAKGLELKNLIDSDKESFFEMMTYNYYNSGYSDYYFDGDSDSLNETYKYYIEEYLKTNELKDELSKYDLPYNFDTIDDLLDSYKEKENCLSVINDKFDEAMSDAQEKAFDKIKGDVSKIIYFKYYDEIIINTSAFIIFLNDFEGEFFTKDEEKFKDNVINLIENILESNDEVDSTYDIDENVRESGYNNMDVDNEYILSKIKDNINDAFEAYIDDNPLHDYDDESESQYGDEKNIAKLKSEIIGMFEKTLKSLGQDPNKNVIQNDIVKIEFDKKRFNLDGKIFAHVTDLKNKKGYDGYMNIKDIPTYFKNYKLFEEVIRIKKLF